MLRHTSAAVIALLAGFLLLAGTASLLWVCAEASGSLVYVLIYLIALVPGLPLGFALFGRRHAAGWVSGALLGYALTAVALSLAIRLGADAWVGFLCAWVVLLALTLGTTRTLRAPLIALPSWSRRDTAALLLVLLLVPALMWLPYAHNGQSDGTGIRFYRAYFTADFVWHMALTGELRRLTLPPVDPYFADQTMHYYWMYFMVPAAGASMLEAGARTTERCLEVNAVLSGLLFVAALLTATWAAVPRAAAAATAVALGMTAASIQGWYGMFDLYSRGRSLTGLRGLNIHALTNWILQGLRIDGLPRSLWWTPQHGMACALGLIAMIAASAGPSAMSTPAIVIVGVALGGSLIISPLLGGVFALIYGLSVVIDALAHRREGSVRIVLRHALAAVPVVLALTWCAVNQMFDGAGNALAFGFADLARHAPLQTLLLALGPLLVPALTAVVLPGFPASAVPYAVGAVLGLVLLYFVRLVPDAAYVGFRAGQILQITLCGLSAVFIARVFEARRTARVAGLVLIGLLVLAGLPTTVIDVYNAQDTDNRAMAPGGFKWTIEVTPEEQSAFAWIGGATLPEAVVQMEPTSRGRETWSLLPSFAHRRMAAGMPIALLEDEEHTQRLASVREVYETPDAQRAWALARQLRIDYLYVDRVERRQFPSGVAKLALSPDFLLAYRNDEVLIYAVRR